MYFESLVEQAWSQMSEESKLQYFRDEDAYTKHKWFAWYPVVVAGKYVWLKTVWRQDFLVHCTGTLRTEYNLIDRS